MPEDDLEFPGHREGDEALLAETYLVSNIDQGLAQTMQTVWVWI
jgi:hypothetical protein